MKLANLSLAKAPYQHLMNAPVDEATDTIRALQKKGVAVHVVRGGKSGKVADLFCELSAALQFPHYFGENWDAFADCLQDLAWIEQGSVVIVFTDADKLLKSAKAAEVETFKNVIADATAYWNESKKKSGKTLHVIFQSQDSDTAAKKWGV